MLLMYVFRIETQKEMLQKTNSIERYVEIGPAKVLSTMIQKSATLGYSSQAASQWSHFRFLSSSENKGDLYYAYVDQPQSTSRSSKAGTSEQQPVANVAALQVKVTASLTNAVPTAQSAAVTVEAPIMAPVMAALAVPDASLSASDVVLALTAQKLKKPFDQVSTQKSIRDLSGGS
jgi:fatty acid synthase subunit alpha, fungi type